MHSDILANLVITGVRSVSNIYNPAQAKGGQTDRRRWAIVMKYEGQTVYTAGGKTMRSDRNHIALLPKGCSYEWTCIEAGHFVSVEFECESSYPTPILFPVKNGERILKRIKELEYKRNLKSPLYQAESIRDVYSILLEMARSAPGSYTPEGKKQKLQPALEYISSHYDTTITNDALAEIAGMSTVYFRKLFSQVMGVSPIVYARQLRIEKAKQMLRSDYGSLSHVALSLGYANLYDFSRDFKKHTGIAPSKY